MGGFPTIAGFEFTALLGRGGMAAVYAAVQPALDRHVAVKVVDPQEATPDYLQRLENEARSLAGLRHPNIVPLHQFGRTDDGALYYVMPLLTGGDLSRWQKPLAEKSLVELLDTLLDALGHAHAHDIVHRDIKPENILFDQDMRPMLADFGAALRRSLPRTTAQGIAIGSAGYMSPEQARGAEVDARSDLYSLAVLAFEMLTGELPFDGPDALAVAIAQCEQPVPTLPESLSHWQPFFDRALAFAPHKRFTDAADMRAALHRLARRAWRPRLRWYHGAAAALLLLPVLASLWLVGAPAGALPAAEPVEDVLALIERRALLPPAEPNALQALLTLRREGMASSELAALQALLLDVLALEMTPALERRDLIALQTPWSRWRHAVDVLGLGEHELVRRQQAPVEHLMREALQRAADVFDRSLALSTLDLLDEWPDADPDLLGLAAEVRRLPLEGERFRDRDGPDLLLVRRPVNGDDGLAVMAAPPDPQLFARFAAATGRRLQPCPQAPPGLQGCVSLGDAQALADWLSREHGARYRVPTRRELAAVVAHVDPAPLHAWTTTCRQVTTTIEPNAAQRAWGGVRRVFGGTAAETRVERNCDGYLALPLDGRGAVARAFHAADPQTTVVLMREVRAGRAAGAGER